MTKDSTYIYNENGVVRFFGPHGGLRGHIIKSEDAENLVGEWNTLDLYTFGGSSIHMVNGKIVMRLHHSRQLSEAGLTALVKGRIQLQSEGAEIFFRGIEIQSITQLP